MINKSLTTLGKVITALTDKKSTHIPYRESKLTRILSESLGGNSKTCLIITCSPHTFNEQETLSTLRFGTRARSVKNAPKVNREYTIPELKKLLEKAEKETGDYKLRCTALEGVIRELGAEVPAGDKLLEMAKEKFVEAEKTADDALQELAKAEEEQFLVNEALQEKQNRIEILED